MSTLACVILKTKAGQGLWLTPLILLQKTHGLMPTQAKLTKLHLNQ
jgi:hypothetical protein